MTNIIDIYVSIIDPLLLTGSTFILCYVVYDIIKECLNKRKESRK